MPYQLITKCPRCNNDSIAFTYKNREDKKTAIRCVNCGVYLDSDFVDDIVEQIKDVVESKIKSGFLLS